MSAEPGQRPNSRRPNQRPSAGLLVLAASGPGWFLWWPAAEFAALSDEERAAVASRQAALFELARAAAESENQA